MITAFFLEDGTFLAADSAAGRSATAEAGSLWATRASDPATRALVIDEMLTAPQTMNVSPADPRGLAA